jgi:hypothetical protein
MVQSLGTTIRVSPICHPRSISDKQQFRTHPLRVIHPQLPHPPLLLTSTLFRRRLQSPMLFAPRHARRDAEVQPREPHRDLEAVRAARPHRAVRERHRERRIRADRGARPGDVHGRVGPADAGRAARVDDGQRRAVDGARLCAGRVDKYVCSVPRSSPRTVLTFGSAEEAKGMLQGAGSRFDFHINKTLCDLRTREIFDIIIDFPDSMGALQDLRECLQRVDQRANLVQALRKAYVCPISTFFGN